ncbi:MAG: hypothetical protein CM15mP78_00010 [Candidatus Poseidoniales archaeon]|nr:MAG: hypothetical protein CM15mP78_00010 [Candidatus Poseidoniales archaeon]
MQTVTAKGNGSWNASNTPDDLFRGRGIVVWGGSFLNIHSNEVYETPNSGIRVNNADYVRLVNNKVYKTTWWSYNAESGIVIAQSLNHENVTNQDGAGANNVAANTVGIIKMRIENNIVYENINKLVFFNPSSGCEVNGSYSTTSTAYGCGGQTQIKDGSGVYITEINIYKQILMVPIQINILM